MDDHEPVEAEEYPDPVVVRPGGWMMGSSSGMFHEQLAADIYMQDIWRSQGIVRRVATVCVSWGMSIAVVEQAMSLVPGRPGPWEIRSILHPLLVVQDFGQQPLLVPFTPPVLPNHQPHGVGHFALGDLIVAAPRLPWHHRLSLRVLDEERDDFVQLHYHKHLPRKDHKKLKPPKIRGSRQKPTHWVFDRIVYSTQIQNCRRAEPVG